MRKLVLKMSMSVDGFVCGPNGEIDWLFRSRDEKSTAWVMDTLWQAGVHIMGSRTFRDMIAFWPASLDAMAAPMNQIPKAVFSRKGAVDTSVASTQALKDATRIRDEENIGAASPSAGIIDSWRNAAIYADLAAGIAELKSQPGKDILAHGGAGFARSLVGAGLVDEYRLAVHPVALGRGLPIFSGLDTPLDLRLIDLVQFPAGTVAKTYRAA